MKFWEKNGEKICGATGCTKEATNFYIHDEGKTIRFCDDCLKSTSRLYLNESDILSKQEYEVLKIMES